jgi:putative Ca2+/H+ antiporter (TMEM165/GDT1 family)
MLIVLQKPGNLPDKPHDLPHPLPKSADKDHLDVTKPDTKSSTGSFGGEEPAEGLIQPLHSYLLSLTMILFSEIGDKTFLIAALMAMKHDRLLVFSAAFSALIAMTILSAVLGHAVPTLLPKRFTNFAAAILFLVFGAKMLREGLAMSASEGVAAEMQEVEMELEEKEHLARQNGRRRSSISPYALEMGMGGRSHSRKSRSGSRLPSPPRSPSSSPDRDPSPQRSSVKSAVSGLSNLFSLLLSPAWVQTFVMTFLGEWGDRSQIATIAMAAGQDYWWVTGGAVSGHAVCTGVAVIGGRAIAGKVSLRVGKYSPPVYQHQLLTNCSHPWRSRSLPRLRCHLSRRSPLLRLIASQDSSCLYYYSTSQSSIRSLYSIFVLKRKETDSTILFRAGIHGPVQLRV